MRTLAALPLLAWVVAFGGDFKQTTVDLSKIREGGLPRELFVIDGDLSVKRRADGNVIEISGEKREVDAGAVLGTSAKGAAAIEARILTTKAGRSSPRFGIGVHGQTGFRLFVVPARKELQLLKNDEVVKSVPFAWESGSPVMLSLSLSRAEPGDWTVTGTARTLGTPESAPVQITLQTTSPPPQGQCSIWGTPYAGTPIDFDRIKVGVED